MRKHLTNPMLAASAALLAVPAYAQTPAGAPERWHQYHYDFGWGHMLLGSLMMVLLGGGLIVLTVLAVRYFSHGSAGGGERPTGARTPLQIVEGRFARGQIDKEEFEQLERALSE